MSDWFSVITEVVSVETTEIFCEAESMEGLTTDIASLDKSMTKEFNYKSPEELTESSPEKMGLTDEEKAKIKEETGWSDEIIDAISSIEEYEIYKNAGLVEVEINGKKCLVRSDIDWDQKDAFGQTNRERAEQGKPPVDKNGKPIELHHIGQKADGPLAELTQEEHRGKENDSVLHDKTKESEIDRNHFGNTERPNHWKDRIAQEEPKNE